MLGSVGMLIVGAIGILAHDEHEHSHIMSGSSSDSHIHGHTEGHTHSHSHAPDLQAISSLIAWLRNNVFKFNARYNSIIATLLIQILPYLIIFSLPGLKSEYNQKILVSVMVPFAMGIMLGDIFLHLIPESDPNSLGIGLFIGFVSFLFLDKIVRILLHTSDSHGHNHGHGHSHSHLSESKETDDKRNRETSDSKLNVSVILNIISGLIHNITDGVALASSFYNSTAIGVISTVAILFHEIPHSLGDFAILLSNGFTFSQTLKSQSITTLGSLIGAAIGCYINELPKSNSALNPSSKFLNLDGMMVPVTAGGFLYVASTNILPQILETNSKTRFQELGKWLLQLACIVTGFFIMGNMAE